MKHRLPRWVIAVLAGSLALCVAAAVLGYVVALPKIRTGVAHQQRAVAEQIAATVAVGAARRMALTPRASRFVLTEADLDVNTEAGGDQAGIEWGTAAAGARIFGVVTRIAPASVALLIGEGVRYDALPTILSGRLVFIEPHASTDALRLFLTEDGYAAGMADGVNRALAAQGLEPVAVALADGAMTITARPVASSTETPATTPG